MLRYLWWWLLTGSFVGVVLVGSSCAASPSTGEGGSVLDQARSLTESAPTATPTATPMPTATATPSPTPTVTPTPTPVPARSYLEEHTLYTVYGRAFGVAPILGMLGAYQGYADLEQGIAQPVAEIDARNGDRGVIRAVHLIYGLAIPCEPGSNCLLYLDDVGVDIVKEYIEPAAQHGWLVILDTQNGRASPREQVQRMIDKGYLNYEHVHVALDPEFASVGDNPTPGIPVGTLDASEINEVQEMLDAHVRQQGLKRNKILIVHQFGDANVRDGVPFMIQNKQAVQTRPNVDLVIDADGFGTPDSKVSKYNLMTDDTVYPFIRWRGIKLFYPNAYEQAGHYDQPPMDFDMIYGRTETPGGERVEYEPDVIIVA